MTKKIAEPIDPIDDLDAVIQKVKARGGPAAPWHVDLKKRRATLGPIELSFYPLVGGGFSPQFYRRSDQDHDIMRDRPLLEDAFVCIANAISKAGLDWASANNSTGNL